MFRDGGFSPGRGISAGNLAGSDFLGNAARAKRLGARLARTRAVLGWVRHVVSRMGDVVFLGFASGGSIALWRLGARVFNVDVIRLNVGGCLPAPRLKVGNVDIA